MVPSSLTVFSEPNVQEPTSNSLLIDDLLGSLNDGDVTEFELVSSLLQNSDTVMVTSKKIKNDFFMIILSLKTQVYTENKIETVRVNSTQLHRARYGYKLNDKYCFSKCFYKDHINLLTLCMTRVL